MLFLVSGEKRNAYDYLAMWDYVADRNNLILVAPEFLKDRWPKAAGYQLGDLGEKVNREQTSYAAIEHLFDEIRTTQKDYMIFGHSAGAQLVQRMAFLRPDNRASVMVLGNAGWYLMPEWRKDKGAVGYPYSLLESPVGPGELKAGLARKVLLIVAEHDEAPDDEGLEKGAAVVKGQGETRVDRGESFIKAATAAAQELGVQLGWELNEAPEKVRDSEYMARYAAEAIYGKR
jgi:pimeloyl-ACP methyl ester carboxylesterase